MFGHQCAGGDDAARPDDRAVHDNGAHAYKYFITNLTCMNDGAVSYTDPRSDDRLVVIGDMHNRAILDVALRPDADVIDVSP